MHVDLRRLDRCRAGPRCRSAAGVVLVPLDRAAIDRVWHTSGYPSHGDYRDTHRLTPRAHQAWANDGDAVRPRARRRAGAEPTREEFVDALRRAHSVVALRHRAVRPLLARGADVARARPRAGGGGARADDAAEVAPDMPPPTSWGRGRDLAPGARRALAWTQRSAELAALGAAPSERALRELLALQSSDWAFLITERPPATTRANARTPTTRRSSAPCGRHDTRVAAQSRAGPRRLGVRPATSIKVSG